MNLWNREGKGLRLKLHKGQRQAFDSRKRFVFILAGTQGGKTSFLPWWLYYEIQRCGPGDYLAVTSSYDLFKLKFLPEIRNVFEGLLQNGRYWAGDKILELANPKTGKFEAKTSTDKMWGRVILRSAQSKGGLESATAQAAILDEVGQDDFTLEDWEAILRRLSLSQGRICAATTIYNLGWLKSQIYDKWLEGQEDIDIIQFASVINPAFPKAEFLRAKSTVQDWRFKMFYEGSFTRPAGLIYADFDNSKIIDPFPIPREWPRIIGIDFGGANTAIIHLAEGPGEIYYLYQESLEGNLSTSEHVSKQLKLLEDLDYEAVGGSKSETQQRIDWEDAGLFVEEPPISEVEPGIDRVTQLLKEGRLKVFRGCKGIIDEFGSYKRKLDEAMNPTEDILNKRHFHRLDALRYAASYISEGSGIYVGMVEYAT